MSRAYFSRCPEELPIATDWSDVSRVAFENEQIRRKVNALIADIAKATVTEKKRALKAAALQSEKAFRYLFQGLLNVPEGAYDPDQDGAGLYALREALQEVPKRFPHHIRRPKQSTKAELARVVEDIIAQFKILVEKNDLSDLLWINSEPRKEKAGQLLFYGVAEAYCSANNIDISPETDSGGGPVDFKFSQG